MRTCARGRRSDEDLGVEEDLAGAAIHDRNRLPGVVDEQFLAGTMLLPHHQVDLAVPGPVQVAEPAVPIPLRGGALVFLPQQGQGDALAPQFLVDVRPQGDRAIRYGDDGRLGEQKAFQLSGIEAGRKRPGQPRRGKPAKVLPYGAAGYRTAAGNLAVRKPADELESKDFLNLAHGQSLRRHPLPPPWLLGKSAGYSDNRCPASYRTAEGSSGKIGCRIPATPSKVAGMLPDQVADFHRNGWPGSTGIGGRLPNGISGRDGTEYAACYQWFLKRPQIMTNFC
jgi:hypothetical protein